MIAVDTNVLVYAHRQDCQFHLAAAGAIRQLAEGMNTWAIPWPCVHEFLAIVTHPRIYDPPSTIDQATGQVDAWLAAPTLHPIGETVEYWPTLRQLIVDGKVTGPLVHDARVAAICRIHGITELWSADRDFSRFAGLEVHNPLVSVT